MKMKIIAIILFIILMLVVTSIIDSFNHSYTDVPEEADVIIMVAGDNGRMEKAAELYHEGYAEHVMITPVIKSIYSQSKEFAVKLGIPEAVIIEEEKATSTYTNATNSLKIMGEHGFESALIVTSDYHLKRSKMIFDKVSDGEYELKYIASYGVNGKTWKDTPNAKKIWFSEFYKLWGYRLGFYNFIDVPDDVDA